MTCTITIYPPPFTGGAQIASLPVAALNLTSAWGPQPASATITYVSEHVEDTNIRTSGIAVGAELVVLTSAGHYFRGVCKSDVPESSSSGRQRTVSFADMREYLSWDFVFGAFNLIETVKVPVVEGGNTVYLRRRRYAHILPANYAAMLRTYTSEPYSAGDVLDMVMASPTLRAAWTYLDHAGLDMPVYDLDWTGGRRLDNCLSEIGDRCGLVFTHHPYPSGTPWRLRWARKGFIESGDTFPVDSGGNFPSNADQCRDGFHLSDNPASVWVVGDRNKWQLADVTLTPDWPEAWTSFYDTDVFLYHVWTTLWPAGDATETPYEQQVLTGDPGGVIARQMALARATEMTVGEFATLSGAQYADTRTYGGVSRMGMPVILYIQKVVLRAFRLPDTININGSTIPTSSVNVMDEMLCSVTHDPVTGAMTFLSSETVDGNGYAIVQGCSAGRELFDRLSPERFDLATWTANQEIWKSVPFQWDSPDMGGRRSALFETQIYRSPDRFADVDGKIVPSYSGTYTHPPVRVSMVVEADRFCYLQNTVGVVGRLDVVNESGLHNECLWSQTAGLVAIPYDDGQTAPQKAAIIATAALGRPVLTRMGGFTRAITDGMVAQQLNGQVDRVTVRISDRGWDEEVDFTTERGRGWEPVRDYSRRQRSQEVFSGQADLRKSARESRVFAAALRSAPGLHKMLSEIGLGSGPARGNATVSVEIGTPDTTTLSVGTPLFSEPGAPHANKPSATTDASSTLAGITVRHEDPTSQPGGVPVATAGVAHCRVSGPVAVGDSLGRVNGQDYLAALTSGQAVAVAREPVTSGVKLIQVWIGGSGGGSISVPRYA